MGTPAKPDMSAEVVIGMATDIEANVIIFTACADQPTTARLMPVVAIINPQALTCSSGH